MPAPVWYSLQPGAGILFWGLLVVLLVLVGVSAAGRRRRPGGARWRTLGLSLLAAWVLLELASRTHERWSRGVPWLASTRAAVDPTLGWSGKRLVAPAGTRPRLLAIGDSFTQATGEPEDGTWYGQLARELRVDVSVVASGGWGTLQELLAAEAVLPEARPDLVVLQMCSNDVINADWELDRDSVFNRNLGVRPYWIEGRSEQRFARPLAWPLLFLATHSRAADRTIARLERLPAALAGRGWLTGSEQHIARHQPEPPLAYRRGLATTALLVARLRDAVSPAPLVAFVADPLEPYRSDLERAVAAQGVRVEKAVAHAILDARKQHLSVVKPDGAHWNANGQVLAGQTLARALAQSR